MGKQVNPATTVNSDEINEMLDVPFEEWEDADIERLVDYHRELRKTFLEEGKDEPKKRKKKEADFVSLGSKSMDIVLDDEEED